LLKVGRFFRKNLATFGIFSKVRIFPLFKIETFQNVSKVAQFYFMNVIPLKHFVKVHFFFPQKKGIPLGKNVKVCQNFRFLNKNQIDVAPDKM
jgi:hypothetical protein